MTHTLQRLVFAALIALAPLTCAALVNAENWPAWRGPRGDGSSIDQSPPLHWDASSGENISWRTRIPGRGHSSPVIWNDRIFLTTCLEDELQRQIVCLDRHRGNLLWSRTVLESPLETVHGRNSRASGTPTTDGESIFVAFMTTDGTLVDAPNVGTTRDITTGQMVVLATDMEGNSKWQVTVGSFVSAHGFCACPVLFDDLVIVNGDHDGDSYIVALDKETGAERWRRQRAYGIRSYVTPIVRSIHGHPQLVFSGSKRIVSLRPHDGSPVWTIEGPTEQFVASMVYDGELFFMACGFPDYHVMAIHPDRSGDVTDSAVAWRTTSARCYVPSPVVVDGYLFVADDRGTANCFDAKSGERYWQARLGKGFSASLIHAAGNVYFTDEDGRTAIVRPSRELDVIAENSIDEYVSSSPAISEGTLFLRGEHSLFAIRTQD